MVKSKGKMKCKVRMYVPYTHNIKMDELFICTFICYLKCVFISEISLDRFLSVLKF